MTPPPWPTFSDDTARNIRDRVWTKAPVILDQALWQAFHAACLARGTHPSKEIQRFIATQLAAWQLQRPPEAEHG